MQQDLAFSHIMLLLKEKNPNKSPCFWGRSGYEKGPHCIFYDGYKIINVSNVFVEYQTPDTLTVILEMTFNNYNVFFKK